MHVFPGGASLPACGSTACTGIDRLTEIVRAWAADHPDDRIVYGVQASYQLVGEPLTRHHLDRVLPDRPLARPRLRRPHGLGQHHGAGAGRPAARPGAAARQRDRHGCGRPRHRRAARARGLHAADGAPRRRAGARCWASPPAATPSRRPPRPSAPPTAPPSRRGLHWCARHGITSIHNMDGNPYQLGPAGGAGRRRRALLPVPPAVPLQERHEPRRAARDRAGHARPRPPRPADQRLRQAVRRRRARFHDRLHARRLCGPARQPRPAAVHARSRSTPP